VIAAKSSACDLVIGAIIASLDDAREFRKRLIETD
jgi:hypothetical protein